MPFERNFVTKSMDKSLTNKKRKRKKISFL